MKLALRATREGAVLVSLEARASEQMLPSAAGVAAESPTGLEAGEQKGGAAYMAAPVLAPVGPVGPGFPPWGPDCREVA
mgnify:CR=1 FL=1